MDHSKTSDEEIYLQNLLTSAWNKSKAKDSKIQEQAEEIQELKRKLEGNRRQSGSPSPSVILTGGRLTEEPFQGEQRVNERVGDRRENPIEVEREGSVHAGSYQGRTPLDLSVSLLYDPITSMHC